MPRAADLMTRDVAACRSDDSAADAARLMWERDCGVVPVVDDGKLRGVVTDRDLFMAAQIQGKDLRELRLSSLVRGPVATVSEGDDVQNVLGVMADRQVRRVPVVDRDGRLVGILSLNDLALHALDDEREMVAVARALGAISHHRELARK